MARDFKDPQIVCYDARGNGDGGVAPTITGDHQNRVTDYTALAVGNGQLHQMELGERTGALNCMHDQQAVVTSGDHPRKYIVRRLTPIECARLQGFPDEWCEGLGGSDSAIYKAYGNGLALPCAYDVLNRIARSVENDAGNGDKDIRRPGSGIGDCQRHEGRADPQRRGAAGGDATAYAGGMG